MPSVVKLWVSELSFKQQTVLLSALRGCDGRSKKDISKAITRYFRHIILKNADNGSSFMKTVTEDDLIGYIKILFSDIDSYPLHFILHLFHAFEIVGYKHPDEETRTFWHQVYLDFSKIIHFNPETEEVLDKRLSDKN